jgi:hypothetical protein
MSSLGLIGDIHQEHERLRVLRYSAFPSTQSIATSDSIRRAAGLRGWDCKKAVACSRAARQCLAAINASTRSTVASWSNCDEGNRLS